MPPPDRTDEELVGAAQTGDRAALETLLHRHHDRLYALCHRLTGGADADDACQESLIAIVRGLPSFDGRSSFSTWTYRVATNACFDELRRRRRRPQPTAEAIEDLTAGDAGPSGLVRAEDASPSGPSLDAAGTRLDVSAALASLSEEFRVAVVLRDLCDLTYTEIADLLGVPVGTVRSRIARGRAALVPLLAPSGNPAPPLDRPSS